VTIAIAPHLDETGEIEQLICPTAEAEYFRIRGLTNIWGDLPVGHNLLPLSAAAQRTLRDLLPVAIGRVEMWRGGVR
jgi:hypothetical protein